MTIESKGEIYIVMAASLWGTYGVTYKQGVNAGCDKWTLIVLRPLLAGLIILVFMVISKKNLIGKWSFLVGLGGLAPLYITYPLAVKEIGVGLAAVLLYTAPIWVTMLSPLLGEKPAIASIIGSFAGFLGVILIFSPNAVLSGTTTIGILLGLGAGISYAAYIVFARTAKRYGSSTSEASLGAVVVSAIPVTLIAIPNHVPTGLEFVYGSYLAIGATIIPYLLHVHGLGKVEASKASVLSLIEPVIAIVLGVLLFEEEWRRVQWIGAALILISGFLVIRQDDQRTG
ncbi:MAG: EamA family transporter [Desulfurococcales archaeon]|nr:EamA family transporter [Desulfurococcales archaeon]